ncbi:MAG: hypothetical protein EA398_05745 [Deltaproteobacteria bacterium]|nr:MAG: hypothetical protein EA398_05745 [Deltaproteobacteria bacterium]
MIRQRILYSLFLTLLAAALTLGGCASDPGVHGGFTDEGPPDRPNNPGTPASTTEEPVPDPTGPGATAPAGTTIEFITPRSVNVQQDTRAELAVRLVQGDAPVPDVNIDFRIPDDQIPAAAGSSLANARARTDADGRAAVELRTGTLAAQFQVRVSVPSNADVEPVTFVVRVADKDSSDYIIQALYDGPRQLETVHLFLYFDRPRLCSTIRGSYPNDPGDGETAWYSPELTGIRNNDIPAHPHTIELDEEPMQFVVAYGTINGRAVTYGCADGLPIDNIVGQEIQVDVPMIDLYPIVSGTYSVDTVLSIYDALPGNIRTVLDLIFGFFEDPAGALVGIIESIAGSQIPGSVRPLVIGLVNDLLREVLPSGYTNFADAALEVRDIFQNLELGGEIEITREPDVNGLLPGPNTVVFDAIYITFQGDRFDEDLSLLGYRPIEGDFTGSIQLGGRGLGFDHALQIDPFDMTFRYGQILVYVIERIILPEFFGVEGFEAFIREFIDCQEIAQSCGGLSNTCLQICNSAISALADTIRDQFLALEADTTNTFILQTPDEQPCPLIDNNDNFQIDAMGRRTPTSARCQWRGQFRWSAQSGANEEMPGNFYGTLRRR